MKIRLLGTGTPTPSIVRASSSYMVEIGDDLILFDHGPGAHWRLLEAGKRAVDVTHAFFSHLHYDHCLDYIRLVLNRWDQGGGLIPELKVYGPAPIERMTRQLFDKDGVFGPDLTARTSHEGSLGYYQRRGGTLPRPWPNPLITELANGDVVAENGWKVTTASVIHHQPYLTCYGFRLDSPDGSMAYSGDTGPCQAMVKLAKDCDVMIHMCQHISGTEIHPISAKTSTGHRDLANIAAEANVKNLVISHVTVQMDTPGVRERVIREMGEVYAGNIFWGDDLMEIPLGDPMPRRLE